MDRSSPIVDRRYKFFYGMSKATGIGIEEMTELGMMSGESNKWGKSL